MSRPLRLSFPGAVYHVMARGNAKALIFLDDRDYERFLEVLELAVRRFGIVCLAFCLMPNHYHLVIKTPQPNLSPAIKHLNGVYSQWWNHRHERCGHAFQGRFKAQLVQCDRYLAAVCRYVVHNPVRAGLASSPGDWRWSSYRASAELAPAPPFLDWSGLLELIPNGADEASGDAYRRFVDYGEADAELSGLIRADRRFLGDSDFLADVRGSVLRDRPRWLSRKETDGAVPSLERLFRDTRDRRQRNEGIRQAVDLFGYRRREIAQHLGLHPVFITQILRRARRERSTRGPSVGADTQIPA